MAIFFFCGIGGTGMSSIARYLRSQGHDVRGDDRKRNRAMDAMEKEGIRIFPYDGSGVTADINCFVMSTAVEETNPDLVKARALGLKIKTRPEMLADILNAHKTVAVGGTSGKTTTTAMVGHILYTVGKDPTMINGGVSLNTYNGMQSSNCILGKSDLFVAETDESNGTIDLYIPSISIVTNISLDHKTLPELRALFDGFIKRTKQGVVINLDCPETAKLDITHKNRVTVSVLGNRKAGLWADDIKPEDNGIRFVLNGDKAFLPLMGDYNVENALCAMAACRMLGVDVRESLRALQSFKGVERRMQILGVERGVTVIDDFAHNPEKMRAAINTLKLYPGRLWVIFQPHGYAPLRLMKDEFVQVLNETMAEGMTLIMPEVLYLGGTTVKDVSSKDVIDAVAKAGHAAYYLSKRADIIPFLVPKVKNGDRVVIMGARDDTLTEFGKMILKELKGE